jgi:hypothetical protein
VLVQAKVNYWRPLTLDGKDQFGAGHRPRIRGWRQELAGSDPALYALLGLARGRELARIRVLDRRAPPPAAPALRVCPETSSWIA